MRLRRSAEMQMLIPFRVVVGLASARFWGADTVEQDDAVAAGRQRHRRRQRSAQRRPHRAPGAVLRGTPGGSRCGTLTRNVQKHTANAVERLSCRSTVPMLVPVGGDDNTTLIAARARAAPRRGHSGPHSQVTAHTCTSTQSKNGDYMQKKSCRRRRVVGCCFSEIMPLLTPRGGTRVAPGAGAGFYGGYAAAEHLPRRAAMRPSPSHLRPWPTCQRRRRPSSLSRSTVVRTWWLPTKKRQIGPVLHRRRSLRDMAQPRRLQTPTPCGAEARV